MWTFLIILIIGILIVDLALLNKPSHVMTYKKSLELTIFYIIIAILFGFFLWHQKGGLIASDYFTAYILEKSLSVDNLFVIALIFKFFDVEERYQHRILFWGIIGVIVSRGILITSGAFLIEKFDWMLPLFSAIIIVLGIKMFFQKNNTLDIQKHRLYRFLTKHLPLSPHKKGGAFFYRLGDEEGSDLKTHIPVSEQSVGKNKGKWVATPLFVCLLMIEGVDVIFALDSIPAVFAITKDPFIVFSSNMFAIFGLRSLYFIIGRVINSFHYLHYSLSAILIFIGIKGLSVTLFKMPHIPAYYSLGIIITILALGILPTVWQNKKKNSIS